MKKTTKVNRQWINDHITDAWVKLAQKEGYRSRAVYKLKEIDEKFNLLKPGAVVVDLGCAPGAWSQYIRNKLRGPDNKLCGAIFSLDILPMEHLEGVQFLQGDFREEDVLQQFEQLLSEYFVEKNVIVKTRQVDVVVSDMAPNLSGVKISDAARVELLVELALGFALQHLKQSGSLVVKLFHGNGYSQLVEKFKQQFKIVKAIKPQASRDKSAETFLLGMYLK